MACVHIDYMSARNLYYRMLLVIARVQHKHVIRLLGYCNEGVKRCLVYEYMHRGTLENCLQHVVCSLYPQSQHNNNYYCIRETHNHTVVTCCDVFQVPRLPLVATDRIRICIEVASALSHLHNLCPVVVHRDVKRFSALCHELEL